MKITNKEREQCIYLHRIANNPARQFLTLSENPLKTCQDYYKNLGEKYGFDGTKVINIKEDGEVILNE